MHTSQDISAPHKQNGRLARIACAHFAKRLLLPLFAMFFISAFLLVGTARTASAETRTLNIEFVHTGEKASITFKRNGRYDPKGLKQLNYILRDWRRNEPTKMDPRLFDLVWEVYKRSGGKGYIKAVSGYRSPQTNAMLRSRSKGVAKESQHMRGTAMDFYIPGVSLKTIRENGVKLQAGGVGYYPNSGSPFVHLDVGGVRAWPRMNRQDLVRLFPDGKTVHLPSDGKPLPGYQQAMAEYKKRLASGNTILMAEAKSPSRSKNLLAMLFGGGDEDEEEEVSVPSERPAVAAQPQREEPAPAVVTAAEPVMVASALPGVEQPSLAALPVPQARPSLKQADASLAVALYQPPRNAAEDALSQVASGVPVPVEAPASEFADLQAVNIPIPTLLGPRGMPGNAEQGAAANVMTASIDPAMTEGAVLADGMTVPVPSVRPSVAEALLANADSEIEAEVDEVEQAILSPEAAEALEKGNAQPEMAAAPVPAAYPKDMTAVAKVEDAPAAQPQQPARYIEVASIDREEEAEPETQFGDMFDTPVGQADGVEAGLPTKGGRPSELEAEQARMAMTGGAKLTKSMITQWALSKDTFATVSKPVKAPRIVARSLSAPGTAIPVGFKQGATSVDPSRFGQPKS